MLIYFLVSGRVKISDGSVWMIIALITLPGIYGITLLVRRVGPRIAAIVGYILVIFITFTMSAISYSCFALKDCF
jgi:hypothetical protein